MLKGTRPYFKLLGLPISQSDLFIPHPTSSSIFYYDPSSLTPLLGSPLGNILTDLHYFTEFISYYRFHGKSLGDRESSVFESWNSSLEHRLLSFVDSATGSRPHTSSVLEALRVAAILWMSTALWTFPLSTSLVLSNVKRLVDKIEVCNFSYWCSVYPDVVIWILVVGACCTSTPGEMRTALLRPLGVIAFEKGIRHEDDLMKALRRFIWMEGVYESQMPQLWKEVLGLYENATEEKRDLETWKR
jgi:hypothetical protein